MNAKILTSLVLLGTLATACKSMHGDSAPAAAMSQADQEKKWMEYATPGPAHEKLAHKVGRWDAAMKHYMPGQPPIESTGKSEMKWGLDGHYLMDTLESDMMGMSFKGLGISGFDNAKKAYFVDWYDSFSTGVTHFEGKFDADARTFTYEGSMYDAMAGDSIKTRIVEHQLDDDHWTMKMYMQRGGKMELGMEVAYTRLK